MCINVLFNRDDFLNCDTKKEEVVMGAQCIWSWQAIIGRMVQIRSQTARLAVWVCYPSSFCISWISPCQTLLRVWRGIYACGDKLAPSAWALGEGTGELCRARWVCGPARLSAVHVCHLLCGSVTSTGILKVPISFSKCSNVKAQYKDK